MKFRLSSLSFCLLSPVLWLQAAPVDSHISAVTVYQDRAVVTRTATVQLTGGTTELVFANLPQALNEQSLQVSGKGAAAATILRPPKGSRNIIVPMMAANTTLVSRSAATGAIGAMVKA